MLPEIPPAVAWPWWIVPCHQLALMMNNLDMMSESLSDDLSLTITICHHHFGDEELPTWLGSILSNLWPGEQSAHTRHWSQMICAHDQKAFQQTLLSCRKSAYIIQQLSTRHWHDEQSPKSSVDWLWKMRPRRTGCEYIVCAWKTSAMENSPSSPAEFDHELVWPDLIMNCLTTTPESFPTDLKNMMPVRLTLRCFIHHIIICVCCWLQCKHWKTLSNIWDAYYFYCFDIDH